MVFASRRGFLSGGGGGDLRRFRQASVSRKHTIIIVVHQLAARQRGVDVPIFRRPTDDAYHCDYRHSHLPVGRKTAP